MEQVYCVHAQFVVQFKPNQAKQASKDNFVGLIMLVYYPCNRLWQSAEWCRSLDAGMHLQESTATCKCTDYTRGGIF